MTKGKRIGLTIVVGIPLFCGLVGWTVIEATFGSAARKRDEELRAARLDGIPTDAQELSRLTAVPVTENASPIYAKIVTLAADGKPLHPSLKGYADSFNVKSDPKIVAEASKAYPKIQPILDLARQAARYPRCDFARDWSGGWKLSMEDMDCLEMTARALLVEATEREKAGDWKGALDNVACAQRISAHAGETPSVVGMLVQIAIEAMSQRVLAKVIDDHAHERNALLAAKAVHDGFGPLANYRRSLLGEFVIMRAGISQLRSIREQTEGSMGDEGGDNPTPIETAFFSSTIVRTAFDAKLIHAYRHLIEEIPKNPDDWQAAQHATEATGKMIEEDNSLANSYNRVLFPVFSQATIAIGVMQAHRRLTSTALSLLLDRIRTGKLPRYLPKYGDMAKDPFASGNLIYRPEGKGFVLYSVGEDRIDNGGVSRSDAKGGPWDEVFRISG